MKIIIKRNGTGTIKEFENKEDLMKFAASEIERKGVINNENQAKIVNLNKSVTIDEILDNIDYTRIK